MWPNTYQNGSEETSRFIYFNTNREGGGLFLSEFPEIGKFIWLLIIVFVANDFDGGYDGTTDLR